MSDENKQTKLHFTRVRSKGDSSYFDPQTDIRRTFPTAAKLTLDLLMDTTKDEALKKDYEYLAKCYNIFQIRLMEDPTNLALQVAEFESAIRKAQPQTRAVWRETMLSLLNCLYALFTRRDVATDGKAIKNMLNTAMQASILQKLPKKEQEMVYAAFEPVDEDAVTDPNGKVVCEETEQVLENIKELAGLFISHSGAGDWDSLSQACDAFFRTPEAEKLSDDQKIAVALAYPSYELPYLTVEKTDD